MNGQDFRARFRSTAKAEAPRAELVEAPVFDRAALEAWAHDLRAGLPARTEALSAQFARALELAGGKFYTASDPADAARIVCAIAEERNARSVVAWDDPLLAEACAALQAAGINLPSPIPGRGAEIGLTTCAYALAETGTLILIGGPPRARLVSLLPTTHVALIRAEQLLPTFADAVKLLRLQAVTASDGRLPVNIALHTGPSRTADIEQTLTRGMHGPKEVHVIQVG
ncbi:MAG: lactate utilization protein [Chloroflexi bacterium]|nr:lactate utilization protein [Chloroflexota bacterium]